MAEYDREFFAMCSFQLWSRSFNPVEIGVRFAAGIGLVLRHSDHRRSKPTLGNQSAVGFPVFYLLFTEVTIDQCRLFFRHLGNLLRFTFSGPRFEDILTHSQGEEIHFVPVAALKECYVFGCAICISLMGV